MRRERFRFIQYFDVAHCTPYKYSELALLSSWIFNKTQRIVPTLDISTMMIETHNSTLALLLERYYNWAELPVFTEPAGAP